MQEKNEIRIRKPQATGHGTLVMLSMLLVAVGAATQLGVVAQRYLVDELTPERYRARPQVARNVAPATSVDAISF